MSYIDYVLNTNNQRFSNYSQGRKLYLGEHYEVFGMNQFEYFTNSKNYLVYNYFEVLTNSFSNLIWSEAPSFVLAQKENQDYVDELVNEVGLMTTLRECTETASYAGDAVVRLRKDGDKTLIEQIDNSSWFPIYNTSNPSSKATGHIIRYIKKVKDSSSKDKEYWLLEIHTAGLIEWEAYELDKDNKPKKMANPMIIFGVELMNILVESDGVLESNYKYKTGCDLPLVFHLKNNSISNEFFGLSDYTVPLIAKNYALNQNLNQIQYVLKRHAHPKMVVDKKTISDATNQVLEDDDYAKVLNFGDKKEAQRISSRLGKKLFDTTVAQEVMNKIELFPGSDDRQKPEYITWQANLDESRAMIDYLGKSMLTESQVSPILVDPSQASGGLSGIAILRMAQTSLWKAEKKQSYLRTFIANMLYSALQLNGLTAEYPTIKFRDGLVNDVKELIDEESAKLDAGLQTKVDAISNIEGVSSKEAELKYQKVLDEQNLLGGNTNLITVNDTTSNN